MNKELMPAAGREDSFKKKPEKLWKRVLRAVLSPLLAGGITAALFFARYGIPLWGVPDPGEVESVTVAWGEDGLQEYTGREKIGLAVKLLNHLNYQPFTPVSESSEDLGPDVTVTYLMKSGGELTAGANWVTGWWNGEARALKEPDVFVRLAQGLFPPDKDSGR